MGLHRCLALYSMLTPQTHCAAVGGPKERFFDSPSAFSVYLKRLVNPDRKADDGWKTVKYKDKCAGSGAVTLMAPPIPTQSYSAAAADSNSPATAQR